MDKTTPRNPQGKPTPPPTQHPARKSTTSPPVYSTPSTPPTLASETNSQTVVCMYIPSCDTGSQMRKAISHIFGRNKMCTRLIPQHIWVHYCRKHYQRSRYRNPREYAKLQCDLVQEQIRRVHFWSEGNRELGLPGVVQGWTLALRKREQERQQALENKLNRKRKRPAQNPDGDDDDDAAAAATDDNDLDCGNAAPDTAVPEWFRRKCGTKRYTTQEVCEIFNQLHQDILDGRFESSFPDLEILPNIIVDHNESMSPKGYIEGISRPTHRRSQSSGVTSNTRHDSQDRRSSQPLVGGNETSMVETSWQKKRRPNLCGDQEPTERTLPQLSGPRRTELETERRGYSASFSTPFQATLLAATPQQVNDYSMAMAVHLNDQNEYPRPPSHGYSQSDIGTDRSHPV